MEVHLQLLLMATHQQLFDLQPLAASRDLANNTRFLHISLIFLYKKDLKKKMIKRALAKAAGGRPSSDPRRTSEGPLEGPRSALGRPAGLLRHLTPELVKGRDPSSKQLKATKSPSFQGFPGLKAMKDMPFEGLWNAFRSWAPLLRFHCGPHVAPKTPQVLHVPLAEIAMNTCSRPSQELFGVQK